MTYTARWRRLPARIAARLTTSTTAPCSSRTSTRSPAAGLVMLLDDRLQAMSIYDVSINALDGSPSDLHELEGKTVLLVNVASQCGLTPQYTGLEQIHERFRDK